MSNVRTLRAAMALLCLVVAAVSPVVIRAAGPATDSNPAATAVLVVAGGPDKAHNQVAIESNARYVLNLFPHAAWRKTLFADGRPHSATVLYESPAPAATRGQTALDLILVHHRGPSGAMHFREPRLPQLDGPASKEALAAAIGQLAQMNAEQPRILYFTGHGDEGTPPDGRHSTFLLWHDEYSVAEMEHQLARIPAKAQVTLIMAQCYAGGFANLLFTRSPGDKPGRARLIPQDLAGFFGTTADRVAAGCTPGIREADYQDFTTYFMAALSGKDRLGKETTGADYNHDGEVGMDEAYCYALIHDPTVDVPVCTSDAYVRERYRGKEADLFQTPLASARDWATPAQAAALDTLLAEQQRGTHDATAATDAAALPTVSIPDLYRELVRGRGQTQDEIRLQDDFSHAWERFDAQRHKLSRSLLARWPELRRPGSAGYGTAREAAAAQLGAADRPDVDNLLTDSADLDRLSDLADNAEAASARRLRLLRLFKTIVLTHRILTGTSQGDRQELTRILQAEHWPLFHA